VRDGKGKEGEKKTPTNLYCQDIFIFYYYSFYTSPSLFIVIYYFIIFFLVYAHWCVLCSILIHPPLSPPYLILPLLFNYCNEHSSSDIRQRNLWTVSVPLLGNLNGAPHQLNNHPPSTKDPDPFSLYLFLRGGEVT